VDAAAFSRMARALPGAAESCHHGHPDFRRQGRVFATLGYPEDGWGMVKLTREEQARFLASSPGVFVPANGAWGKAGSTMVHLGSAPAPQVRAALQSAWELAGAPKPPRRRRLSG
jgi:hypothetical protein